MRTVAWFAAVGLLPVVFLACGDSEVGTSCPDPAPLGGTPSAVSPEYLVTVIDGVDVVAETHRMEMEYGFTATDIFQIIPVFAADLTPSQLLMVRCDAVVARVNYNGLVFPH